MQDSNKPNKRRISLAGLVMIMHFESFQPVAYLDDVGKLTIGYGHTSTVEPGQRITKEQAKQLLMLDCDVAETRIAELVTVPLTDSQFSALVSFVFNVGITAFARSTLLKKLNAGDYEGAANELLRWNKAGGRELAGLTRRRNAEREMFLRGDL